MPIEKGKPWGEQGSIPAGTPVVDSDAKLASLWAAGFDGVVALRDGDMCKTLGGRGDVEHRIGHTGMILPIDVGECLVTDRSKGHAAEAVSHPFVAHVVSRGRMWGGETMVAMNAEWLKQHRLAPRGHPGDGRLDVTIGALAVPDRIKARARTGTGDHLPHPNLTTSRVQSLTYSPGRRHRTYVDGLPVGTADLIELRLHPSALRVVV